MLRPMLLVTTTSTWEAARATAETPSGSWSAAARWELVVLTSREKGPRPGRQRSRTASTPGRVSR